MEVPYIIIFILFLIIIILTYMLISRRKEIKAIRKDAIEKSRLVLEGKFKEQLAPFLPDFNFNPTDARFLGSPIDFVVFDGAADSNIKKIVFVEVKSGKSKLTKKEEQIREVIYNGNVEFKICRI
ncbi:MAG: Holliday junction resolvase [Candidatus Aenigmatarchaeota archaeon]|nr:MAG: Holliday junction resolvase [Candidatus Aenigmarchaeota archaeon]